MKNITFIVTFVVCVIVYSVSASGAALSILPEAIELHDVTAGETYAFGGAGGVTWKTHYRGRSNVTLVFKSIAPERALKGFDPIPDSSWLAPERAEFDVGPGESVETSVTLTIPDDDSLHGKRFVVILEVRARDSETGKETKLADHARVFFTVNSPEGGEPDQSTDAPTRDSVETTVSNYLIALEPRVLDAGSVRPGFVYETIAPLEIINAGLTDRRVRLGQTSLDKSGLEKDVPDFQSLPDGSYLIFENRTIIARAGWATTVPVFLAIPENGAVKKGRYAVVVTVTPDDDPTSVSFSLVRFSVE